MKLEEIADLHNRRGNIGTVARECAAHKYPLLVWPEDKALLRLADLPAFNGKPNRRVNWTDCEYTVARVIGSDEELREFVKEGRAYKIANNVQGFFPRYQVVVEYRVETREVKL